MILGLKLKHDTLGGKTMHDVAFVLVGCIKSLSVISWSWRFYRVWFFSCSEKLSTLLSVMFKGSGDDILINLPLYVQDQHFLQY